MSDKYPVIDCCECGQPERATFFEKTREEMIRMQLCFSCLHWTQLIDKADDPRVIRFGGMHTMIGTPQVGHVVGGGQKSRLGCGGQDWWFKMDDGRLIHTNNLWHQGTIPIHFRDRLPDNASQLTKEQFDDEQNRSGGHAARNPNA